MRIAIYTHSIAPSIDGVCRRFTGILHELIKQKHEVLLFTLEDKPEEIPIIIKYVTIFHLTFPTYPGKKVAIPITETFTKFYSALQTFKPEVSAYIAATSSLVLILTLLICRLFIALVMV